ncbi:Putative odorant-binding protein [Gryllus bimaculatus]|nr:Putative odorant-binding protein [Gryllus bimaculatus]
MASLGACPAPLALSLLLLLWPGLLSPPPLASAKLPLPAYIKPCNASAPIDELEACATRHAQEGFPSVVRALYATVNKRKSYATVDKCMAALYMTVDTRMTTSHAIVDKRKPWANAEKRVAGCAGDRRYKVPALNPLLIPRMVVDDGQGPLGLNLVATDLHFGGMENVRIDRVRFDMDKKYAWYDVLNANEACVLTEDMFISYEYRFNLERRPDGEVYFIPLPHDGFRFNTSRLYVHLDNLFNGDPLLGDNTNKFMNDNWEEMLVSLGPIFSTAISEIVHSILTNIFQLVPFTDAFTGTDKYLPP